MENPNCCILLPSIDPHEIVECPRHEDDTHSTNAISYQASKVDFILMDIILCYQ